MRKERTREREGTLLRQQKLTLAVLVDPGGRGGDDPEFICRTASKLDGFHVQY